MPHTKAYLLRSSIAFALMKVKVQLGRQVFMLGLSEEQRHEVADRTIAEMRRYGAWKDLDDVVDVPVTPRWKDGKPPGN